LIAVTVSDVIIVMAVNRSRDFSAMCSTISVEGFNSLAPSGVELSLSKCHLATD